MAKYIRGVDRNQPMLLPSAVDDYISEESPLRALDAFVDTLDFTNLGFGVRDTDSVGRSSYDPCSLTKLYLWGYLKRSRSSRNLEEACSTNLGVIWLTGNLQPDHSTISDFRKKHSGPLKKIFREFNLLCIDLELFGRELIAIDGTFTKGVNSTARSFTRTKLKKLIEGIDTAIEGYLERLDTADANGTGTQDGDCPVDAEALQQKIDRIRERKGKLEGYLAECETTTTGQVNLTDRDSRQLCKGGKKTIGYNTQIAVDAKHHLVITCEVTQESSDQHLLDRIAQQAKADLGLQPDDPLEALADSGYATGAELRRCESHHTVVTAPPQATKGESSGKYTVNDFTYDSGSDSYRCPNGMTLSRKADNTRNESGVYRVYQNSGACRDCGLRANCTKSQFRKLEVSEHKSALDAARARVAADPKAMRRRGALVEHPFGTVKSRNGRSDHLCRGIELAGVEMRLSFWAYNFTRVINLLGSSGLIAAMQMVTKERKAHLSPC